MEDGRCSRPAGPRGAPACRRDRSDPRPGGVRATPPSRSADQDDEPVVHLRDRSGGRTAESGLRHRSRRRAGRGAQSSPTPAPGDPPQGRAPVGLVSGGRPARSHDARRPGPPAGGLVSGGQDPDGGYRGVRRRPGRPSPSVDHPCGHEDEASAHETDVCSSATGLPVRPLTRAARRLLAMITWYQRGAEGRPSPCRFFPSCSSYAHEAIEVHGSVRGTWLSARRLLRCRPFGPSGVDMVPAPRGMADERPTAAPVSIET